MPAPVTPVDNDLNIIGSSSAPTVIGGNVASDAADSGNPVKVGGVYQAVALSLTTGDRADLQTDVNGNLRSRMMTSTGVASDGFSNTLGFGFANNLSALQLFAVAPFKFNGTTWDRDGKANTVSRLPASANTNNATSVKGSAGTLFHINGLNATAGVKYLKLYNKATAPTVGADTPFLTLALAASTPFRFDFPGGLYFSTGIGFGIVTGAADADNTAVAANDILGQNISYI